MKGARGEGFAGTAKGVRRAASVVLVAVIAGALAACGAIAPRACPAIGWSNTLTVEIEPASASVGDVEVCWGEECIPVSAPAERSTPWPNLVEAEANRWVFDVGMNGPEVVTIAVADAQGVALVEQDYAVEWVRVGGTEECGGPAEATVEVTV